MTSRAHIEELVADLYHEVGGDPQDIVHIIPIDGDWPDARSYQIIRNDGAVAALYRKDIVNCAVANMRQSLRSFEFSEQIDW